jgi:hypothetical protein
MVFEINLPIFIYKIVLNYVQFAKIKIIEIDFNYKYWEKNQEGANVKIGSNLCKVLKQKLLPPSLPSFFPSLFCPIPHDKPVTVVTVPKVFKLYPASAFLYSVIIVTILVDSFGHRR